MSTLSRLFVGASLSLALLPACVSDTSSQSDDLTSAGGVEREVEIHGLVYVDVGASNDTIQRAVQQQVRTAFGPLRIGQISVDDREFRHNVDPSTFQVEPVKVMRTDEAGGAPVDVGTVQRVSYVYKARGLAAKELEGNSTFSMALLMGNYQSFVDDIIHDCVENYEHDHDFASSFWYVFAPNEPACQARIQTESEAVARSRSGLEPAQISEQERNRWFLPVTVALNSPEQPAGTTYPEYHRLYGLDDPNQTTISVATVFGVAAHDDEPESTRFENDMGFDEFFKMLTIFETKFPALQLSEASEVKPLDVDFNGQLYTADSFQELGQWATQGYGIPTEIASADRSAFRRAIYNQMYRKWFELDVPLDVTSAEQSKAMTLQLHLLFGAESDYWTRQTFKSAFKQNQIVIYNGHSYIGSGALDPTNYSPSDFRDGYQILFFNSCVSFNYYSVDYFGLKAAGSKDLELVTNGLEVYINDGGKSMGQFITSLFDGQQHTWLEILERTRVTSWYGSPYDPNRAVDGELDNEYTPAATPITVQQRD